jgi:hypothetical protein
MTDPTDSHDISDPADTGLPMLNSDAADPTEPMDRTRWSRSATKARRTDGQQRPVRRRGQ